MKILSKMSNTFLTLSKSCQKFLTLFSHCQNLIKNVEHFFHTVKILSQMSNTFLALSKSCQKFLTPFWHFQKFLTLFWDWQISTPLNFSKSRRGKIFSIFSAHWFYSTTFHWYALFISKMKNQQVIRQVV